MKSILTAFFFAFLAAPHFALYPAELAGPACPEFPPELVEFGPPSEKPLLSGRGANTSDRMVRERGWVMREDGQWHMWFTGYNYEITKAKFLGYATSTDGIT